MTRRKCACGCGTPVSEGKNFAPEGGHDSALYSKLCKEHGGLVGIAQKLKQKRSYKK